MFILNNNFLNHMNIGSENVEVKDIKLNGTSALNDFVESVPGVIDVHFKENIIQTSNGLSNKLSISEKDFYNWFDYEVVTYCYVGSDDNSDFEPECCHEGDFIFKVPLTWLAGKLNEDSSCRVKTKKIDNLADFLEWNMNYTHEEGYHIYTYAISENVLMGVPEIKNCNYCCSRKAK